MSTSLPPFDLTPPTGAALPIVVDSPHSGMAYPSDFGSRLSGLALRRGEDTWVHELYASAPRHGATLLAARFPRAYIDPNRSLADIDTELLADAWPDPVRPSRKTVQGIGLVWRMARDSEPMYDRKLTSAEVRSRIERCWRPYHAALAAALDERHRAFGVVYHLDCHSMPAVGDANADDPGRERADFVLGDRDGTTCEPAFTALVAARLASLGYEVAINDPYKGVELVRVHGRPAEGRHSLQVEVKRTLYMDEHTLEPNAGFARLRDDLALLASHVAAYVVQRSGPR